MYAHRTITNLAVIAATGGFAVGGAATAQAATPRHHDHGSKAIRKAYTAPLLPLSASDKATPSRRAVAPCIGAGPLARRGEFIKGTTDRRNQSHRRNRWSTSATCSGVIEY